MSKVFIVLSKKNISGGGESLHQLVSELIKRDIEAYIYYFDQTINSATIVNKFSHYRLNIAEKIEDSRDNYVIVPEVYSGFLTKIENAHKIIWWLSVDFYQISRPRNICQDFLRKKKLPQFLEWPIMAYAWVTNSVSRIPRFSFSKIDFRQDKQIFHFFNCEYVRVKLIQIGIDEDSMCYLCGPLANLFFKENSSILKKNYVAYNPRKGLDFTKMIISYAKKSDFEFKPIENLSVSEVNVLLKQSKVYIDFGFFPGPERIPREAVMSNCIIITSRNGAAENKIDVPIPEEYKFDTSKQEFKKIYELIEDGIDNYEERYIKFDRYRNKVKEQVQLFEDTIDSIAILIKNKKHLADLKKR